MGEALSDRLEHRPMEFVGVAHPNCIYVGIKNRAEFDKIDRPLEDRGPKEHGHVLIKTVEQDGTIVIFQHWLLSETAEAFLERARRARTEATGA